MLKDNVKQDLGNQTPCARFEAGSKVAAFTTAEALACKKRLERREWIIKGSVKN